MSEPTKSLSSRWNSKNIIFVIVGLLLLARIGYSQTQTNQTRSKQAILQGTLLTQPSQPLNGDETGKIQPGTPVKISVIVENKGDVANTGGTLFVRYALSKPMQHEPGSIIFETEKKPLPPVQPGQEIMITFDTVHQSPSVLDFVRNDWPLREYQAIAEIKQKEKMIGTLAITFSAYYYPGIMKQFPAKFGN